MLWLLAGIHYESGAFEEAYHTFGEIVQTHPDNARAHLMMGYCALQVGRLQDARTAFAHAASCPKLRTEANQMLKRVEISQARNENMEIKGVQYR